MPIHLFLLSPGGLSEEFVLPPPLNHFGSLSLPHMTVSHAIVEAPAVSHQAKPNEPVSRLHAYHNPPITEPRVRNAAETAWPSPCTAPKRVGLGALLFTM